MEGVLQQIGLNHKEAEFYLYLLQNGPQTTMQLASATAEKRTNVYMILDSLMEKNLVLASGAKSPRLFSAHDPSNLKKLLEEAQERQTQAASALASALPRLKSTYALTSNKPGVVHLAGIDGFQTVLNDTLKATTDVLLVASNAMVDQPDVFETLKQSLRTRKKLGIKTKAIFEEPNRPYLDKAEFAKRGIELRFLGTEPYPGEIVVYDDNVLLTSYKPSLVNTVITSQDVSTTMRLMFNELWQKAKP